MHRAEESIHWQARGMHAMVYMLAMLGSRERNVGRGRRRCLGMKRRCLELRDYYCSVTHGEWFIPSRRCHEISLISLPVSNKVRRENTCHCGTSSSHLNGLNFSRVASFCICMRSQLHFCRHSRRKSSVMSLLHSFRKFLSARFVKIVKTPKIL